MNNPTMYLEPGRYLVGDASVLLVTVNSLKQSYRKFIGVDAGFHTLLRPAMYESYHHIVNASKMDAEDTQIVDIAGNVCESGDLFARDRPMPDVEEGDIMVSIPKVIEQAQEYGHSVERELSYMIVNGFYHVMGYDHIKEEDKAIMRPKEEHILNKLNITRQ